MGGLFSSLLSIFYTKKLDIVLVGLAGSGKSTFASTLALGKSLDTVPTIGLNIQIMKKQGVTCKIWDMGGQASFRSEWGRYTKDCDVVVFVLDTQQPFDLTIAKKELHQLLEDRHIAKTPILILANKVDLGPKITEDEIIKGLNLDYLTENPWLIIPTSAKFGQNVDKALQFLIEHAK